MIRQDGAEYEALIQRAVADISVYDSVHTAVVALFEEQSNASCLRAIRVAEHLCDRKFAGYLAGWLVEHGHSVGELPEWMPDAIAFVGQILVPTDPRRTAIFKLALSNPQTRIQGWKMSRQEDAAALLPWIPVLLRDYPEEAVAIGIKFALVWQEAVPELALILRDSDCVGTESLATVVQTIETYLLRVRRVRLWREFSRDLNQK